MRSERILRSAIWVSWHVEGDLRSFGDSAIGVVNFGVIDELLVEGPILTRRMGARLFNRYRIGTAEFDALETSGDGALSVPTSGDPQVARWGRNARAGRSPFR